MGTCKYCGQSAEFIQKNLPFVVRTAFIAMEHIGHAVSNERNIWIEPIDYADKLTEAVFPLLNGAKRWRFIMFLFVSYQNQYIPMPKRASATGRTNTFPNATNALSNQNVAAFSQPVKNF